MATCAHCSGSLPEGARFCPNCAASVEPEPAAKERKLATVLFADLVGSTELGGSLDPEHTRDLLDRFYDAMAAEIALGGGTVEKFIGDAVVAAFGAPAAREDHPERALDAALSMQRRLSELFGGRLALRIGVNTGEVVVGRPREGSSFVTGDAVNVAARLEQAARPGQILVGERTAAAVGAAFEFAEATRVEAKGKPGGVVCRELVRMVSPTRPRGAMGLQTAFVGRDRELAWLERELACCRSERRPRLASLVGEAGVGKTSLVREFRTRLPEDVLFRIGRCVSYGRGVTYSPLADVLRAQLGLYASDTVETVLARLAGRVILGLTLGLDVGGDLDPRGAAERLRTEWVRLVSELAAAQPVVLVVEDLHWASEPLRELLERLLAEVEGPLLLLVTTRPDRPGLRGAGESSTLEPLTAEEADRVLHRLLGSEFSGPTRDFLVQRAEGNPFFLEELLSTLIQQGVLILEDGCWRLSGAPATLEIPDSVQALLAARIDLLPPAEKTALQAASVIGRTFAAPALAALTGTTGEIRTLVERGFLRQGEPDLVFKHALTWEVVYGSLPKASRARLHASFASWLEATGGPRDDHAAALAHHYAQAVDPEIAALAWRGEEARLELLSTEAFRWLRRAAELAVGRFDIEEAVALLRRAVELAPEDGELWRRIGRASALRFDGEGYWEAMLKAVELTSDPVTLGEIYGELAFESTMRGAMWKRAPDDALVVGWIGQALELAAPDSRALAHASIAKAMRDDDVPLAERAIAIAERLGDLELLSHGFSTRSALAQGLSDYAAAQEWARRRFVLAPRFSDPDHLALIEWGSSTAELAAGQLERAEAHAHSHEEIAARLSPHHAVHAISNVLTVWEAAGRWDEIRVLQRRTEQAVAENAETPCIVDARLLLACAAACAELGLDADARRLEEDARALGFEGYGLWLDPVYARLALLRGDLEQVEALLEGSEKWLWSTYNHVYGAATRLDALVAVGRKDDAEAEAIRLLQPGTYLEPFALRTLGLVRGDGTLLVQAVESFEAMGLDWHAAKTRNAADQPQQLPGTVP
jgi:class 3 adenylate cyclase